jgi:PKD repeat protein
LTLVCFVALAGTAYAAAPVANFVGSNCAGAPSLTVSFTDASTNNPTSWSWTFGDGGSSTSQSPTHTYTALGNYTVTLAVTNASGSDTIGKADFAIVTNNRVVNVNTSESLRLACWNALDGDVIMVADGTYPANNKPWCRLENKTGVILRSASGDASRVTLQGYGWDSKPEGNNDLLWVWGSSDITVCFLHFEEARSFGIKVTNLLLNGRAVENLNIHDCSFLNIGVRMIKGTGGDLTPVQTGSIRQCHFENTKIPPRKWQDGGNYITAIDMMVLHNWTIADNVFKNIKGNSGGGRGAIFAWVECQDVTSERNVITGCDRSIAYGNPSGSSENPDDPHMTNGVIRNNFIVNTVDTGIELCWVNGIKVYQNTVLTADDSGKGIHYQWNTLENIHIANNIVRGQIYGDEGADVTLEGNLQTGIQDSWFNDVATGDLHLTALATPAIDEVNRLADAPTDFDQEERPTTPGMTDIGADEYAGGAPGPPVADFSGNPTGGNAPLTVAFTDLSTGSPTSWSWTFGDSGSSAAQNPSHTYNSAAQYTVSLTVTNAYGQDSETKPNYITVTSGQPPVAQFVGNPTSGSAPLNVAFSDQSSGSPTSWSWTFGDGGSAAAQHPSHTYNSEGQYTVSLTATNQYGWDDEVKTNYITVSSGGQQDYLCSSCEVVDGTLQAGDHTSVHASDDVYLQVLSAKVSGKYAATVVYYYNTGLGSLSSLTVTSESHPSVQPQRQRIWLYNFSTSQWVEVDVRDVTTTTDETTVVGVSSPSPYRSASGEVRVKIRQGERINNPQWTHYIDLVKITAAP